MLLAVPLFAAGYRLIREDIARRNSTPVQECAEKTMVEQCSDQQESEENKEEK